MILELNYDRTVVTSHRFICHFLLGTCFDLKLAKYLKSTSTI